MLDAPDRLDGRSERGGSLGVDQDRPDQFLLGAGEPAADGLVATFRQFKLAVGQFESLAQTFQNADKLGISHDGSLIGVHFTSPVSSAKSPMVGAAVNLAAQKLDFAIGAG